MQINEKHLLTGDIRWTRTPNHSGRILQGTPDTIIIHYTGGSTAESSVRSLCNPASQASAHLVIGRDGIVYQLAPFDTITWHAGKSTHAETGRTNINRYSIGIELDNAGVMTKADDNEFLSWFGKKYPREEVIEAAHRNEETKRWWHLYTDIQIRTTLEICQLLKNKYPIRFVLGHEEISPGRKIDPGPSFPLERFREKILDQDRSDGLTDPSRLIGVAVIVNVDELNVRSGAGATFPKVSEAGLLQDTPVKVVEVKDKWCRIEAAGITGWVNGKYLIET